MHRFSWVCAWILVGVMVLLLAACRPLQTPGPTPPVENLATVIAPTPAPTPEPPPAIVAPTPAPTSEPPPATVAPTPAPTSEPTPSQLFGLPDVSSVVEDVRDSVVSVVAEVEAQGLFGTRPRVQSGSGVIIDNQGHILTNNHVIEGSGKVTITLGDGRQLDATIRGADSSTDLAVLRVEDVSLPYLPFADPSTVRVGQWVIAIGNALALPGGPSVTIGIVSAVERSLAVDQETTLYDLIQTDTVINPGNSGGPLLNMAGEVVGINTAVLRSTNIEGIGFAVSGETAIHVSNELIEWGSIRWPWLGIVISDLNAEQVAERQIPTRGGILVQGVVEGGPAERGGLRADDVIVSLGGQATPEVRDLIQLLRFEFQVHQVVDVEVWRAGEVRKFQVLLGERPSS